MLTPPGYSLLVDVAPFDARWVLLPGLGCLSVCAVLVVLRARTSTERLGQRRLLGGAAVLVLLAAAWWTLGGIGAWRAGGERLSNGTANFVEGTVVPLGPVAKPAFQVAGQTFQRPWDAFVPPLHAVRWPTVPPETGAHVRLWFFGEDVLRLEVAAP